MFIFRKRRPRDVLETVLINWTRSDPFTVRDLLNGGVAIFGRSGSGKTSSSPEKIIEAALLIRVSKERRPDFGCQKL